MIEAIHLHIPACTLSARRLVGFQPCAEYGHDSVLKIFA